MIRLGAHYSVTYQLLELRPGLEKLDFLRKKT